MTQLDPLPLPSGQLDDMSKYQACYKEAMNPFKAFRGQVCCHNVTGIKSYFFKTGSYTCISKYQSS
jgi:hypothetical protein